MNLLRTTRILLACLVAFCPPAFAAADGSQLKLPDGVDLAIVVFEDLQCPDCRNAHPYLVDAARANNVLLIIYDYPIPRHNWAFPAAVLARYFTQQSPALGVAFRSFIFQNQPGIGADNLRRLGEQFAAGHQQQLPGDVDPDGKLAAHVQADFDFARQIHIEYVPLMFVLSRGDGATRAVEVKDAREMDAAVRQVMKGG